MNKKLPERQSIRLDDYDYSQPGGYFITICTQFHKCLFGEIIDGKMVLNDAGQIARDEWLKSAEIRDEIKLNEYVIMPNHIHGIVTITDKLTETGERHSPLRVAGGAVSQSIGSLVAGYKSSVTAKMNKIRRRGEWRSPENNRIWQRNYWDHIIRNENEYSRIAQYIIDNPEKWDNDRLNGGNGNIVMEPDTEYEENHEEWMV